MLMLDITTEVVIPIDEGLFQVSQFNSQRKLNDKYGGNIILHQCGKVEVIKSVTIIGVYGISFWERAICFLNSTKSICVQFENYQQNFESIKHQFISFIKNGLNSEDPYMPKSNQSEMIFEQLQNAQNVSDFFSIVKIPKEGDRLDVMV